MDNKKVDPGWNDPPMLNYSLANPPPKSRIINKRVAFPVGPTPSSTISEKLAGNISEESAGTLEEKVPDIERITFSNFDELLKLAPNDSVLLKIELMKNMWRSGQLSGGIKNDIHEISVLLVRKDCDNANKLHLKLFMNSPSECRNWISAMQYFISNIPK